MAFLASAAPSSATAEDAVARAPAPSTRVEITVVGTANDLRFARSLVGAGNPVLARAQWAAVERFEVGELFSDGARENLLACWLDFTDPKRARLYFAAPSGQRFLLRDVALTGSGSEVDRASLAEVLELSVAALLENERTGLTRGEALTLLAETPSVPNAPGGSTPAVARQQGTAPSPPSSAGGLGWGMGAVFIEQVLSTDFPLAQRVGVEALVGRAYESGWASAVVAGEYQVPVETRNADIGVQLQALAAQGGVELGRLFARPPEAVRYWWRSVFMRLGAGMDFVHVAPQPGSQGSAVDLEAAHWSRALVFRPVLGTCWALGSRIAVDVRLFADVLPGRVHYDANIDSRMRPVFTAWRLRPGLVLALMFR